jgi:cysteinyl-tRNA synthetase
MNYSDENMRASALKLRVIQKTVKQIEKAFKKKPSSSPPGKSGHANNLINIFINHMDNNLNVKDAFDGICEIISGIRIDELKPAEASEIIKSLKDIDEVLKVIF